jgi:type II restriction enzyme
VSNLTPWEKDVFQCLLELENDVFTLKQVYAVKGRLSLLHPNNRNVEAKIRQQLQYLRDIGLLEFTRPGLYKKLWM